MSRCYFRKVLLVRQCRGILHRMGPIPQPHQKQISWQGKKYLCPCIAVEQQLCEHGYTGSSSLCSILCFWCTECVSSLIVSLSWHFNGRGTLVSGPSISMVKLFPLGGYFHWPNRIFPFTPSNLCKKTASCVFPLFPIHCLVIQGEKNNCFDVFIGSFLTGCCTWILKKGVLPNS